MRVLPEPFETLRREAGVGSPVVAAAILGAFLVPGLLGTAETLAFWRMAGRSDPAWLAVVLELPQWMAFSLLVPLILWLGQRLPFRRHAWILPLAGHMAFALVPGVAYAAVAAAGSISFSPMPMRGTPLDTFIGWYLSGLPVMILAYFGVLGGGWAVYWFARHRSDELRAAKLHAQLADARLSAMRMQMQPHFLFNSLNAVAVLVRDRDWDRAERAVLLLAGLLRDVLQSSGSDQVPLEREIDFVRRYLELEQLRFGDRLRVSFEVPDDLRDASVPLFLLQPLVENALRHGIAPVATAGVLALRARSEDGRLILTVTNDGRGPIGARSYAESDAKSDPEADAESDPGARAGVGLANTRARLRALYGADTEVTLQPGRDRGAVAAVELPLARVGRDGDAHD